MNFAYFIHINKVIFLTKLKIMLIRITKLVFYAFSLNVGMVELFLDHRTQDMNFICRLIAIHVVKGKSRPLLRIQ